MLTVLVAVAFVVMRSAVSAASVAEIANVEDVKNLDTGDIIMSLVENGIMPVFDDDGKNYFYPEEKVDRCYFSFVAVKLSGIKAEAYYGKDTGACDIKNVPAAYVPFVNAAVLSGIVPVYSETIDGEDVLSFRPEKEMTREEAAYILSKLTSGAASSSKLDSFSDRGEITDHFAHGIDKLLGLGIIDGFSDGTFRPLAAMTHEELAVWLNNLIHSGYLITQKGN